MENKFRLGIALVIFINVILVACSPEPFKETEVIINDIEKIEHNDTSTVEVMPKGNGIDLFIDSMETANFLIDTNRLKKVMWSDLAVYPKGIYNGHVIIEVPFPVEKYCKHFIEPKTYFFAKWNENKKTFKEGTDFLLMTWIIDTNGIRMEKDIYYALQEYAGNFPCYIFRSKNTVYAMCHRQTIGAAATRKLTEQLRNYIDTGSSIYYPFNGREPR